MERRHLTYRADSMQPSIWGQSVRDMCSARLNYCVVVKRVHGNWLAIKMALLLCLSVAVGLCTKDGIHSMAVDGSPLLEAQASRTFPACAPFAWLVNNVIALAG